MVYRKYKNPNTEQKRLKSEKNKHILAMISFDLTPKTKTIKAKIKSGTTSNLKSFSIAEENIKKRKGNLLNGRE